MAHEVQYPVRITHVINVLAVAGMEVGVIKLVNRQDPRRFKPLICCLRYASEDAKALLDRRVRVVTLDKAPGLDWSMVTKLAAMFHRERPHIVHSHNWPTFFYTALAARLAEVPILIHGEHGYEDAWEIGRRLSMKRMFGRSVDRFATVSSDLERVLVERWRVRPERIANIPNGVDLERFRAGVRSNGLRREFGLKDEDAVILSVARIGPVKDFPTLIRGFARFRTQRPSSRLIIVGAGDSFELQSLAASLGVGDALLLPGPREDIPEFLSLCDVYVNTSLFEGMSNTILEAMATGKPVVATAVGGNPELVREGENGFLIPPGDVEALADRLARLVADPGLRGKMGSAAESTIGRHHSISRTVDAYNDLYLETWQRKMLRAAETRGQTLRRVAARAIRYSGLAWARRTAAPRTLSILAFHRVLPLHTSLEYAFQSMMMPRDLFEEQMAHLSRRYAVLTLGEAVERLRTRTLPPRAVTVTFDDGYRDNFDFALPILKKYSIPATVFVVTGAIDGTFRFMWDEVVSRIRELRGNRSAALAGPDLPAWLESCREELKAGGSPNAVGERMVRQLNRATSDEREVVMTALRRATPDNGRESDPPVMTWDELREMERDGVLVGAHTVTHRFLDELSATEVRREIEESVAVIERQLGRPVRFLSYPRGRFTQELKEILRSAGITAALTTTFGSNAPGTDPYALRRVDVGYTRIRAGHDPVLLDVEMQGWFQALRGSE